VKHGPILLIFVVRHQKKLNANDISFGHLTLILSPYYVVKCRSRSFPVYSKEFIDFIHTG